MWAPVKKTCMLSLSVIEKDIRHNVVMHYRSSGLGSVLIFFFSLHWQIKEKSLL